DKSKQLVISNLQPTLEQVIEALIISFPFVIGDTTGNDFKLWEILFFSLMRVVQFLTDSHKFHERNCDRLLHVESLMLLRYYHREEVNYLNAYFNMFTDILLCDTERA